MDLEIALEDEGARLGERFGVVRVEGSEACAEGPAVVFEFLKRLNALIVELGDLTRNRLEFERPCLLYTSPSPRDKRQSRMPSSA